jgi:hypothetical protein
MPPFYKLGPSRGISWSQADLVTYRRLQVSRLRVRGFTQMEIALALPTLDPPILNPKTGKPYTPAVIAQDLSFLTDQWKRESLVNIADHKGRIFQEIQEVKRIGWRDENLGVVLEAISQERQLLGVDEALAVFIDLQASESLEDKLERLASRLSAPPLQLPDGSAAPSEGEPTLEAEYSLQPIRDEFHPP